MTDQPQPSPDDLPAELLERVAMALAEYAADNFARTRETAWETMGEKSHEYFRNAIRAVAPILIAHGRELEKAQGETLESMIAWGDQTFGPCTQQRAIERAGEEWDEMEQPDADVPVEAADVIICLLRIPGIREAINRKMAINRERTWSVRSDGTGYHVKNVEHRSKP